MTGLRRTPLRRVLHRRPLLFGGEREPVLLILLLSGALAFVDMNWPSAIMAAVLLCGIPLLRLLAKKDPQFWEAYRRSYRYQGYYPSRSRPFRDDRNEWDRLSEKFGFLSGRGE